MCTYIFLILLDEIDFSQGKFKGLDTINKILHDHFFNMENWGKFTFCMKTLPKIYFFDTVRLFLQISLIINITL